MEKIKLTSLEIAIIRKAAKSACRKEGATLKLVELGVRCALSKSADPNINIMIVDDTPDWCDSDLYDMREWSEIKKPIDPVDGGKAMVDFYCYDATDLITNIQARMSGGRLVWVGIDGRFGFTAWGDEALRSDR